MAADVALFNAVWLMLIVTLTVLHGVKDGLALATPESDVAAEKERETEGELVMLEHAEADDDQLARDFDGQEDADGSPELVGDDLELLVCDGDADADRDKLGDGEPDAEPDEAADANGDRDDD